ncbi:MAG: YeeE/YedE thiosulfate transporter family protein [Bacteroidota bacterium]
MIELLSQPWHWSVSGILIVVVMFLLLWKGGTFGVSSNLRTLCSIGGAGRFVDFFRWDWKSQLWNLVFAGGAILGGFIASTYLHSPEPVKISKQTSDYLQLQGITIPTDISEGLGYVPKEIFDHPFTLSNLVILLGGGILIGFGTRYAGGCTSGHAISGLSNFQLPSLIAVIGFFIGGLTMSWLILPYIL